MLFKRAFPRASTWFTTVGVGFIVIEPNATNTMFLLRNGYEVDDHHGNTESSRPG
jgi:hypothetical protein